MSMSLKNALEQGELVSFLYDVKGSRVFMPYGWSVRNKILDKYKNELIKLNIHEIGMPNLISESSIKKLDSIYSLSNKYSKFGDSTNYIAATHEAAVFSFISNLIDYNHSFLRRSPISFYFISPAFRAPKKSKSPFNFGERNSFLQIYIISKNTNILSDLLHQLFSLFERIQYHDFKLPTLRIARGATGNLPLYQKFYGLLSMLKSKRTIATGMLYDQSNLFTKPFLNKQNSYSIHAGITDNIIYSFFDSHFMGNGFKFPFYYSPVNICITYIETSKSMIKIELDIIKDRFKKDNLDFEIVQRNSLSVSKTLKKNRLSGIPVTIAILVDNESSIHYKLYCNYVKLPKQSYKIFNLFEGLQTTIEKYDNSFDPNQQLNELLIECSNMNEANERINNYGIAYIKKNKYVSRELVAGEILGNSILNEKGCMLQPAELYTERDNLILGRRI